MYRTQRIHLQGFHFPILDRNITILHLSVYEDLISNIEKCKNILIVDECRKTGCHGEGILTDLLCGLNGKSKIELHAAKDSFIPLGVSSTSTLPSKKSIVQKAFELING